MLLGQMIVGFSNLCGQDQTIMLHAFGLPQLLVAFSSEHLAQCIWRIDRSIYDHVGHVDAFR